MFICTELVSKETIRGYTQPRPPYLSFLTNEEGCGTKWLKHCVNDKIEAENSVTKEHITWNTDLLRKGGIS